MPSWHSFQTQSLFHSRVASRRTILTTKPNVNKKGRQTYVYRPFLFIFYLMAGAMGLEPTTYAVTGRHCNQLNYAPAN
jgi:hypothetical protein